MADIRRFLRLDQQRSRAKRLEEIVKHWNRYLDGHPLDPRAFLERGGTDRHLKQPEAALRDFTRA